MWDHRRAMVRGFVFPRKSHNRANPKFAFLKRLLYWEKPGAGEANRTPDPNLGNVLTSSRINGLQTANSAFLGHFGAIALRA